MRVPRPAAKIIAAPGLRSAGAIRPPDPGQHGRLRRRHVAVDEARERREIGVGEVVREVGPDRGRQAR